MRFLILALWAVLLPSFALADTRPVNCEITVGGVRHVTGRCYFSPRSGGSFQVGNDSYFADVSVNTPGQADGHWNADPLSTHAQAPLGALRQEGACWVAPGTRICAWALPAAETQAALAAQPDGVMLSPISASSACIGAAGH
ncbi:hypothetical protein C8J27_101818 [Rhodobacter aestuarii]|uniref:Uncharacterized protein n=1 Tax=Rhodobacter aestuarii TaxID=453582 RepID=A0A1N7PA67_9RHOB|nr:hypothetical protein [Rhodobacter aestuarii]PTV97700.1 hypothetical protein C8J27_101818 [Rhodobacter aestuarii]SIT07502.1 hypothetical protein SAMN05421580_109178 [Rhodobacter aestuarii]